MEKTAVLNESCYKNTCYDLVDDAIKDMQSLAYFYETNKNAFLGGQNIW